MSLLVSGTTDGKPLASGGTSESKCALLANSEDFAGYIVTSLERADRRR